MKRIADGVSLYLYVVLCPVGIGKRNGFETACWRSVCRLWFSWRSLFVSFFNLHSLCVDELFDDSDDLSSTCDENVIVANAR